MIKTIPINIDCFPQLKEDGFLQATQHSFGRAMKDLFFNRFADVVISNTNPHSNIDHTLKHIPKERIAIDFFKWDYQLDVYRNSGKYEEYLKEVLSKGINKCVGMDFSLWWDLPGAVRRYVPQPGPILINNLYLNICRLKQAQDLGLKTIFNWNNAMVEFRCIYEDILPKRVPIVMADSNHELTKEQMIGEIGALKMFAELSKIDIFIIQSSRQDIEYFKPFLKELLDNGIKYHLLPSQTALLGGVRRKQEFEELIGINSCGGT